MNAPKHIMNAWNIEYSDATNIISNSPIKFKLPGNAILDKVKRKAKTPYKGITTPSPL